MLSLWRANGQHASGQPRCRAAAARRRPLSLPEDSGLCCNRQPHLLGGPAAEHAEGRPEAASAVTRGCGTAGKRALVCPKGPYDTRCENAALPGAWRRFGAGRRRVRTCRRRSRGARILAATAASVGQCTCSAGARLCAHALALARTSSSGLLDPQPRRERRGADAGRWSRLRRWTQCSAPTGGL